VVAENAGFLVGEVFDKQSVQKIQRPLEFAPFDIFSDERQRVVPDSLPFGKYGGLGPGLSESSLLGS
jgi:hypothetical protein